ncbi:sialate O-acetylesterase [Aerococcus viridans]
MAGTDFSHLTTDELIKGIKALKLPDYIRSKAYGVDVRETLAQMTEMTIQLGVNMGLSPEEALNWSRKLQETVSQSEFDSWVATLLDGGPSIFMNTLSELKTTYPNGAPGVALVRETDPAKIYVWNGTAWEDFGDYQGIEIKEGTVTSEKIADKAVTPIKNSDILPFKNLLNYSSLVANKLLNSTGLTSDSPIYSTTDFISFTGSSLTFSSDQNGVVCFYDSAKNLLTYNLVANDGNFKYGVTFNSPANTAFIRVSVRNSRTWAQVESGSKFTGYEDKYYLNKLGVDTFNIKKGAITNDLIAKNSISENKLSDYIPPKNLLVNLVFDSGVLLVPDGTTTTSASYKTTKDYLNCEPNTDYTFAGGGNGVINFYDKNGLFISYNLIPNNPSVLFSGFTVTSPTNATKMLVSVHVNANWYQLELGNQFTSYESDGLYRLSGLDISTVEGIVPKAFNTVAEIEGFISYGQSWAQGYDSTAISVLQPYNNLTLDTGTTNEPLGYFDQVATSFKPLVEENGTASGAGSQTVGESTSSSQSNAVIQLLVEENGFEPEKMSYSLFSVSPGRGSTSLAQLSKGTEPYDRFVSQIQKASELATQAGNMFKVTAFSWAQGSSGNGTELSYADGLEKLRHDLETDIKAITGQTEPLKCITWQPFPRGLGETKKLYEDFVGASERYEHIICAGSAYWLDTLSKSNLHFNSKSQAKLGAMFGKAYKRSMNDEIKFEPLKPNKIKTKGKIALLKFNNTDSKLVLDTASLTFADGYGFKVIDTFGTETTLEVSIVSNDTLKLYLPTRNFNDTDRIVYGDTGNGWGGTDRIRGNLRTNKEFDYSLNRGEKLKIQDWCVVFDKTIQELSI